VTPGDIHYFMGIVADNPMGCILDFSNLASGNAFNIINVPTGSQYLNFQVRGPGIATGTNTGMRFDGNGSGNVDHTGVYNVRFSDVWVKDFSQHGFHWEVPFVTVMDHLLAQDIGGHGFFVDTGLDGPYVGGTSLTFNSTYANHCLTSGYRIEPLVYSSLNAVACDNCTIGYEFNGCAGMTINGLGYEVSTGNLTGEDVVAIKFRGPSGISGEGANVAINSCFIAGAASDLNSFLVMDIDDTIELTVTSGRFYYNLGAETPSVEVLLGSNTARCVFNNCSGYSEYDLYSGAWRKTDAGSGNVIQNGGIPYSAMPAMTISGTDVYGNSLTVTGGGIVVSKASYIAESFYVTGDSYAKLTIANDGILSFGSGAIAQDIGLVRGGASSLTVTNFAGGGNLTTLGSLSSGTTLAAGTSLSVGTNATITGTLGVTGQTTLGLISLANAAAINSGNISFISGWSTSTLNYVSGTKAGGSVGINCSGAPGVKPVVRVTYPTAYASIPIPIVTSYTNAANNGAVFVITDQTTTYFEVTYLGTPAAGYTTGFNFIVLNI